MQQTLCMQTEYPHCVPQDHKYPYRENRMGLTPTSEINSDTIYNNMILPYRYYLVYLTSLMVLKLKLIYWIGIYIMSKTVFTSLSYSYLGGDKLTDVFFISILHTCQSRPSTMLLTVTEFPVYLLNSRGFEIHLGYSSISVIFRETLKNSYNFNSQIHRISLT